MCKNRFLSLLLVVLLSQTTACAVGVQGGISAPRTSGGAFFGTPPILITNVIATVNRTPASFITITDQCNVVVALLGLGDSKPVRATNFRCATGNQVNLIAKAYQVTQGDTVFLGMSTRSFSLRSGNSPTWEVRNVMPAR